jgi:hypothetical protein
MAAIAIPVPSQGRFGVSLPLLLGLLVYGQIVSYPNAVLGDADTYWHIATGRWILAHGAVPQHDVFSFSMPGAPWTSPEWLAEIVIAWLYDHLGWTALVVVAALCEASALALLLRVLLRFLAPIHALIATVLAWALSMTHVLARPHIFTLPILVLWVAALVIARSRERAPSPWLALLITLWADLHSSYMLGLVLAGLLAGEAVLLAPDWDARLRAARRWAVFGALSLAAALITPFGIQGLIQPFELTQMSYASSVLVEWMSPNFQHYQPLEALLMVLLFGGLSLGWRLPPTRVLIVLLLLHMALQHGRHAEPLGLVAPLLLAPALGRQLAERLARRPVLLLDRGMAELAKPANARGLAIAAAVLLALTATMLHGGVDRKTDKLTPTAALAAVQAHQVNGPVFNDYGFGGYLIFAGIKPFIDGRYFYGDAFIQRYVEATAVFSDQLPVLFDEYGITWTLLHPKTPAVVLLDHLPGWRRLYADDIAVVHVREDQVGRDAQRERDH